MVFRENYFEFIQKNKPIFKTLTIREESMILINKI